MSNRKLVILGIVAALMVGLTVLQRALVDRTAAKRPREEAYLIQGLDTGAIASIVIGKGDGAARLIRRGNRFVVSDKDNYPALTKKINDLVTSCLDIRTIEWITGDAANHESLGVTEEKAQNVVKLLNKGGQIITGLVIGSSRLPELRMDKRSTYVRLISSNDVYEATNVPLLAASALDYVEKELVNIDRKDVAKVTVSGAEGSYTLRVDDSNDDNIILEDIPEGKKIKTSDCREVFLALSNLSFDDVKKESSEGDELKFDTTYVSELKDSTVYTFEIAETNGETYVKCSAEYTDKIVMLTEGEHKENEAKLLAQEGALDFAKRHRGWLYRIPKWKAKNLTRKSADLVEEEKADESGSTSDSEEVEKEGPK